MSYRLEQCPYCGKFVVAEKISNELSKGTCWPCCADIGYYKNTKTDHKLHGSTVSFTLIDEIKVEGEQ